VAGDARKKACTTLYASAATNSRSRACRRTPRRRQARCFLTSGQSGRGGTRIFFKTTRTDRNQNPSGSALSAVPPRPVLKGRMLQEAACPK